MFNNDGSSENENIENTIENNQVNLDESEESRSVYVKNVDYCAENKDLEIHFSDCGKIEKITIVCDKHSGHPLGYAYIKFTNAFSAQKAILTLNDSLFKGRQITVTSKRKNLPFRGKYTRTYHKRGSYRRRRY